MKENPYREDREKLRELLKQYENLKNGRHHSFLEEESFEKIIDYYQEKEDLPKAMEAAASGCDRLASSRERKTFSKAVRGNTALDLTTFHQITSIHGQ